MVVRPSRRADLVPRRELARAGVRDPPSRWPARRRSSVRATRPQQGSRSRSLGGSGRDYLPAHGAGGVLTSDPYRLELDDSLAWFAGGPPPRAVLADGVASLRLALAVEASLATGAGPCGPRRWRRDPYRTARLRPRARRGVRGGARGGGDRRRARGRVRPRPGTRRRLRRPLPRSRRPATPDALCRSGRRRGRHRGAQALRRARRRPRRRPACPCCARSPWARPPEEGACPARERGLALGRVRRPLRGAGAAGPRSHRRRGPRAAARHERGQPRRVPGRVLRRPGALRRWGRSSITPVHLADALRYLTGCEFATVLAESGRFFEVGDVEDCAQLVATTTRGAWASIDSSWSRPQGMPGANDFEMTMWFERGEVRLDGFARHATRFSPGGVVELVEYGRSMNAQMLADFVRAVAHRRRAARAGCRRAQPRARWPSPPCARRRAARSRSWRSFTRVTAARASAIGVDVGGTSVKLGGRRA